MHLKINVRLLLSSLKVAGKLNELIFIQHVEQGLAHGRHFNWLLSPLFSKFLLQLDIPKGTVIGGTKIIYLFVWDNCH